MRIVLLIAMLAGLLACNAKESCERFMSQRRAPMPEKAFTMCGEVCEGGNQDACKAIERWKQDIVNQTFGQATRDYVTNLKSCVGNGAAACEAACKAGEAAYCVMLGVEAELGRRPDPALARRSYLAGCSLYDDTHSCRQGLAINVPGEGGTSWSLDTSRCARSDPDDGARVKRCAGDCFASQACDRLLRFDCLGDIKKCERGCALGDAAYCRQLYLFYRDGEGVAKNPRTAQEYRAKACKADDEWSCNVRPEQAAQFGRKLKPRPFEAIPDEETVPEAGDAGPGPASK